MSDSDSVEPSNGGGRKRRKILYWAGGTIVGLTALFLIVVFVLPTPTARYIIESQLERFGIKHEGIETVEIDLWNSEVAAGPVKFRSGDSENGQIGEAGFTYSFGQLFEGRGFIREFFLRGVDIAIFRREDGSITFNGVELEQILADSGEAEETETAADDSEGFGFGISAFEFTDSQLSIADYTGGSLTLELKRLALADFSTWKPETAGRFELEGLLNGIVLDLSGTARPFTDPMTVTLHSQIREATIDKAAVFIGPTGLARQGGVIGTDVRYDYEIHSDGRVAGTIEGFYTISQLDIATAEGESFALNEAQFDVNLSQNIGADKSVSVAGTFALEASPISLEGAQGEKIALNATSFKIEDFEFKQSAAERAFTFADEAEAKSDSAGSAPTIVQLILSSVEAVARNARLHQLTLDGAPVLTITEAIISAPAPNGQPGQEIRFDQLTASTGTIRSHTVDNGWQFEAALEATIKGLSSANRAANDSVTVDITDTRVIAESIEMAKVPEETSLAFDLATSLEQIQIQGTSFGEINLQSLQTGTSGITVSNRGGERKLSGPVTLTAKGLGGALNSEGAAIKLAGKEANLSIPALTLSGQKELSAVLSGVFKLVGLSAESNGPEPFAFGLGEGQLDFESIQVQPLAANAKVKGSLASTLTMLQLDVGKANEGTNLTTDRIDTRIESLSADLSEPLSVQLSGATKVTGFESTVALNGANKLNAKIANADVTLSELAMAGEAITVAADIGSHGIAIQTGEPAPQAVEIQGLRIEGIKLDPSQSIEIARIAIEELHASLNDQILTLAGEGSESERQQSSSDGTLTARLGELTISKGSTITVTDGSIDPPMELQIAVNKALIGPIDTGAPNTQTKIDLQTSVNESAAIDAKGWLSPLKPTPDFDLTAKAQLFPLSPFSPYSGSAVGMVIDDGTLTAKLASTATAGDLKGQIDVLVENLYLEPLSEESGEGFEKDFGVPVDFAVGILKNDEGNIDLGFPVAGTVESPEIDYSEVVSKAIGGAMASLFPTNWFGDDGKSFSIEPVIFAPGTATVLEGGESSADQIGAILAKKPQITVRLCGKATKNDLLALRGVELPTTPAEMSVETAEAAVDTSPEDGGPGAPVAAADATAAAEAPEQPKLKPTDAEVEALLALATERKDVARQYLESTHGIDPKRIADCRTSYSVEDTKAPRAEFRL